MQKVGKRLSLPCTQDDLVVTMDSATGMVNVSTSFGVAIQYDGDFSAAVWANDQYFVSTSD